MAGLERLPSRQNALAVTDRIETEIDDHQPANQKPYAVDGVGNRNRAQPAKQRIDGPANADGHNGQHQQHRIGFDAGQRLEIQQSHQPERAGVKNAGQQNSGIGDHKDDIGQQLRGAIKTQCQKLGHGGDTAFEKARQKEHGHGDQGHDGHHLPGHDRQPIGKGCPIEADHLFGRQIGHQQRARNDWKGQATPGQKITA